VKRRLGVNYFRSIRQRDFLRSNPAVLLDLFFKYV
jgi:hypothetical protein